MHDVSELPVWERLFKQIIWLQLGHIEGKRILDFGSGQGITADHFAKANDVTAVEPFSQMLEGAWRDHSYTQIIGDVSALNAFQDESFDMILCHNVLEYIQDKETIVKALSRVLKKGGCLSIAKHNRAGRVMQMAVLLDHFDQANALLDGENSTASQFGEIRYYEDEDLVCWAPELTISSVSGIRTFWDLQQNQEKQATEAWQQKMIQLEMRVSSIPAYRNIAFFHHLLLEKSNM